MEDAVVTFQTGIQVPALGQGTWHMGDSLSKKLEELRTLRTGIELGMTVIDTAEMYGDGRSEILVGEAVARMREKVFIITKILPSHANRKKARIACDKSLKRLKSDYIDLYLLHWQGRIPFEETVEAMLELQQMGKIRQWGVSNMDVEQMEKFMAMEKGKTCAANEVLYNLTRRGIEYDLLPWSEQQGMPIIAYSPIEQGRLLSHPVVTEIARHHQATATQIALAWVLRRPGILAIPKASTVKHVKENYGSLSIKLTAEDLTKIDKVFPAPTYKKNLEMI